MNQEEIDGTVPGEQLLEPDGRDERRQENRRHQQRPKERLAGELPTTQRPREGERRCRGQNHGGGGNQDGVEERGPQQRIGQNLHQRIGQRIAGQPERMPKGESQRIDQKCREEGEEDDVERRFRQASGPSRHGGCQRALRWGHRRARRCRGHPENSDQVSLDGRAVDQQASGVVGRA